MIPRSSIIFFIIDQANVSLGHWTIAQLPLAIPPSNFNRFIETLTLQPMIQKRQSARLEVVRVRT